MPYVGADGRVHEKRSPWRFSIITDIFEAIYNFFALFLRAVVDPPQQLQQDRRFRPSNRERRSTQQSRGGDGGGRKSNIRGLKNLSGDACVPAGGG
eukprot:CAMPEP_0202447312 /NCGR_PEP_ID=MMETSP1360-20130828/6054_1 /ASSEMBLY_ACC=CAM_ASM_000848 /TAXON_ID=515479 /ORGANISM="Licmophora paradoxa, Strain CCMP2313" /LENGTH=95 /DNA_ID=CAMNT_0049064335 /DNA_START=14 /DNA_END=301 /DNA_ORIENTATION=-